MRNFNDKSIGIELINIGRFPNWFHSTSQKLTEPYTSEQICSLTSLICELKNRYPLISKISGHEDLDYSMIPADDDKQKLIRRKIDPGYLFPWSKVIKETMLKRFILSNPN